MANKICAFLFTAFALFCGFALWDVGRHRYYGLAAVFTLYIACSVYMAVYLWRELPPVGDRYR